MLLKRHSVHSGWYLRFLFFGCAQVDQTNDQRKNPSAFQMWWCSMVCLGNFNRSGAYGNLLAMRIWTCVWSVNDGTHCTCKFLKSRTSCFYTWKFQSWNSQTQFCAQNFGEAWAIWTIRKDAFRMAGPVQKTWPAEMLAGQGADFLRGVAFWSIRSSGLPRWFCVTGAALRMTLHHFFVPGKVL